MNTQPIETERLQERVAHDERGATMVEYGILVALIAAVSILVITTIGTDIQAAFQTIADNI